VNENSWRAALRLITLLFRPGELSEQPELQTFDVRAMSPAQRQTAIAKMVEEHPGLAALVPRAHRVHPES
jgi:hypothetical protein